VRIDVVSIFPDYLEPLRQSLPGKAIDAGIVELVVHDLRRWTRDVHRSVDDSPYGGGPDGTGVGRGAGRDLLG
jgi:tRNA (guanine37-N1)-methyltransferase